MIDLKRSNLRINLINDFLSGIEKRNESAIDFVLQQAKEQYLLEVTEYLLAYKDHNDKKYLASLTHIEAAIKLDPTFALAHILKGSVYISMGEYQKAIESIDYSIQNLMLINYSSFFGNKGVAFDRMGRLDEAISCFLRAIEDNNTDPHNYKNCIVVMTKKKDWLNILSLSEKAREIIKENIPFINDTVAQLLGLARIISEEGNTGMSDKFLEEARKQLDLAITKEPNNASVLYNLACFYSRTNRVPEAIETLKKSIEAMESDSIKIQYRQWALADMDFVNIREYDQFKEIVFADKS